MKESVCLVQFRCRDNEKAALSKAAREEETTMSNIIRKGLELYVADYKLRKEGRARFLFDAKTKQKIAVILL
jgi:hypothetical protein